MEVILLSVYHVLFGVLFEEVSVGIFDPLLQDLIIICIYSFILRFSFILGFMR